MKTYSHRTTAVIYWIIQSIVIFLGPQLILALSEAKGFFATHAVKQSFEKYLILIAAFLTLAIFLDRIHHKKFSQAEHKELSTLQVILFGFKTMLLPLIFTFPLTTFYFNYFGYFLEIGLYFRRILPFFFMYFLLFNMVVYVYNMVLRREKSQAEKEEIELVSEVIPQEIEKEDKQTITCYVDRIKVEVPLENIAYCSKVNHATMIFLLNGKSARYPDSLSSLKNIIGDDNRFFSTGSWIVNRLIVEDIENSFSRKKFVSLRPPFTNKLSLPKEKVSDFKRWIGKFNEGHEQGL